MDHIAARFTQFFFGSLDSCIRPKRNSLIKTLLNTSWEIQEDLHFHEDRNSLKIVQSSSSVIRTQRYCKHSWYNAIKQEIMNFIKYARVAQKYEFLEKRNYLRISKCHHFQAIRKRIGEKIIFFYSSRNSPYLMHCHPTFFLWLDSPRCPRPPRRRGCEIPLRHTTLGRTPDEWLARRRDLYPTKTQPQQTSMLPQFQ